MDEIGRILPAVFKAHMNRREPRVVEILAPLWHRVAGKTMARRCRPVAFSAGLLTLATDCSSWNAQLGHMAEEVRAKINSFLGGPVVKRLRIQRVTQLAGLELFEPQRTIPPVPESKRMLGEQSKDGFDPEITRLIEGSYAKYFSRRGKQVH